MLHEPIFNANFNPCYTRQLSQQKTLLRQLLVTWDDLEHNMKNSGNNVAGFWIAFNRYFEDLLAVTIFDVISEVYGII